jgi:phosphoserine aminotransferase
MITFYPGPSKIYPSVGQYLQEAFSSGILQMNHRSQAFMDVLRHCIDVFKEKQNIPSDYQVFFTSSATECWEIIAQSLTEKSSFHFYNGAFGEKWFEYTAKNNQLSKSSKFGINELPQPEIAYFDVVCFTQNETSNGTAIPLDHAFFSAINPYALIAHDITSSLGGIAIDWSLGDIWLASVQKCLGLPAGMGILILSPKSLHRAQQINDRKHYNSLLFIQENFEKYQTPYTPNILGIYLLGRVMESIENIELIDKKIKKQAKIWYNFIENETKFKILVENPALRSATVIAVSGSEESIRSIKEKALSHNVLLGNGYGQWKNNTFRIANFPAINDFEIETLKTILKNVA